MIKPYFETELGKLYKGDVRDIIPQLDDLSVDMSISSPPYWAQRDYKLGEEQLGQEGSFKDYINNLASIYDSLKPKIKSTLWVNLGDTYYGSNKGHGGKTKKQITNTGSFFELCETNQGTYTFTKAKKFKQRELPDKSLCMIPSRFAIELQDRGWILRNALIWRKPNKYPESPKDRYTHDYEYVFLFSKEKRYYFKQQFEPYTEKMNRWGGQILVADGKSEWDEGTGQMSYRNRDMRPNPAGRNKRSVWSINTKRVKGIKHFATFPESLLESPVDAGCPVGGVILDPFMGSGTTALYCEKLGIKWIGIELNESYCNTIKERVLNEINTRKSLG